MHYYKLELWCYGMEILTDFDFMPPITHKHTHTHSDTVSRCGVFCSFINAMECCKTEGIVDVFQVVKALRIQKPGSVLTVVSMSNLRVH